VTNNSNEVELLLLSFFQIVFPNNVRTYLLLLAVFSKGKGMLHANRLDVSPIGLLRADPLVSIAGCQRSSLSDSGAGSVEYEEAVVRAIVQVFSLEREDTKHPPVILTPNPDTVLLSSSPPMVPSTARVFKVKPLMTLTSVASIG
jgi:hypothetical protein